MRKGAEVNRLRRRALRCLGTVLCATTILGCGARAQMAQNDPWEPFNRKMFWFNDKADTYVLKPVATAWDWALPNVVQQSVSNFFGNLNVPITAANNLLQGKAGESATDLGRFAVNTTVGMVGLFDPATTFGIDSHNEDFGQTLACWGVPSGPYLVLPLLGPSSPRDATGYGVDTVLSVWPFVVSTYVSTAVTTVNVVNARSLVLKQVADAKKASLDFYVFVRNAYIQRRNAMINDNKGPTGAQQNDLYYTDDEE